MPLTGRVDRRLGVPRGGHALNQATHWACLGLKTPSRGHPQGQAPGTARASSLTSVANLLALVDLVGF